MTTGAGETVCCERVVSPGSNLEVADAIRAYLARSNGDTRLALAISVADQVAMTRSIAWNAARAACFGGRADRA